MNRAPATPLLVVHVTCALRRQLRAKNDSANELVHVLMYSTLRVELVGELAELSHARLVAVADFGLASGRHLRLRQGSLEP